MIKKSLGAKLSRPKYQQEVLELFRQAIENVTDEEFDSVFQKLDHIIYRLDLIIDRLDHMNGSHTIIKTFLPKKFTS